MTATDRAVPLTQPAADPDDPAVQSAAALLARLVNAARARLSKDAAA